MRRTTAEVQRLRAVPLFVGCTAEELRLLARNLTEHRIPEGEVLMDEGAPGREFFVIVTGEALVSIGGEEVARLGPGGFAGEMSLLDDQVRTATVVATTDLVVLVSNRQEFAACLEVAPQLTRQLLTGVSGRLRRSYDAGPGTAGSGARR